MFVLGVVGGIASGKSAIACEFERLGAHVLDADAAGHQVLREPEVIEAIRERWGQEVIDSQGQVDRRAVAKHVFGNGYEAERDRKFLNGLTHPRIRKLLTKQLAELSNDTSVVVLDAALLYETGWESLCDGVVFVDTPREQRLQRAAARGWSPEVFAAREASQWPIERKRDRAKWTIDNSGTLDALRLQVERLWTDVTNGQ